MSGERDIEITFEKAEQAIKRACRDAGSCFWKSLWYQLDLPKRPQVSGSENWYFERFVSLMGLNDIFEPGALEALDCAESRWLAFADTDEAWRAVHVDWPEIRSQFDGAYMERAR